MPAYPGSGLPWEGPSGNLSHYNPLGYVHNTNKIPVQPAYVTQPAIGIPTYANNQPSAEGVPIPTYNRGVYGPITLPEKDDGYGYAEAPQYQMYTTPYPNDTSARWLREVKNYRRNYINTPNEPHLRGVPPLAEAIPAVPKPKHWWQKVDSPTHYRNFLQ